jgi:hypothetical protein
VILQAQQETQSGAQSPVGSPRAVSLCTETPRRHLPQMWALVPALVLHWRSLLRQRMGLRLRLRQGLAMRTLSVYDLPTCRSSLADPAATNQQLVLFRPTMLRRLRCGILTVPMATTVTMTQESW